MKMLKEKWLGGGADVAIRATFSFAMCGALAGLMYLTAQNGMADGSNAQHPPRVATVLSSTDIRAQSDQMPTVVAAPAAPSVLPISEPVVASSDIRPVIPTRRPAAPVKVSPEKSTVAQFDSCLPDCETRDPMIVGYAEKPPQVSPVRSPDDQQIEQRVSLPVLAGATTLLGKAFEVPGAAFRKGKSVITTVVNATL